MSSAKAVRSEPRTGRRSRLGRGVDDDRLSEAFSPRRRRPVAAMRDPGSRRREMRLGRLDQASPLSGEGVSSCRYSRRPACAAVSSASGQPDDVDLDDRSRCRQGSQGDPISPVGPVGHDDPLRVASEPDATRAGRPPSFRLRWRGGGPGRLGRGAGDRPRARRGCGGCRRLGRRRRPRRARGRDGRRRRPRGRRARGGRLGRFLGVRRRRARGGCRRQRLRRDDDGLGRGGGRTSRYREDDDEEHDERPGRRPDPAQRPHCGRSVPRCPPWARR